MNTPDTKQTTSESPSCGAACSPSAIYLQWHGDADEPDIAPIPEECKEFVTWCEDKVFPHDVKYIRADKMEMVMDMLLRCEGWLTTVPEARRMVDECRKIITLANAE
jgi:hypothetical protein